MSGALKAIENLTFEWYLKYSKYALERLNTMPTHAGGIDHGQFANVAAEDTIELSARTARIGRQMGRVCNLKVLNYRLCLSLYCIAFT